MPQDIAEAVRRDLARRFPACVGPEAGCTPEQRKSMEEDVVWVNVAAIRWMQNSDQLLMMAWVPDSSAFGANLGRYNGYVVDAHDGRILEPLFRERIQTAVQEVLRRLGTVAFSRPGLRDSAT